MFARHCLSKSWTNKGFVSSYSYNLRGVSSKTSATPASNKTADSIEEDEDWFNTSTQGDIDERVVPRPVSWMPDHLPQTRRRQVQKPWWKFRYFVDIHTPQIDLSEYHEHPQYPPIYDSSSKGKKKQIRMEWYKAIEQLPTAQQKLYEITKHYGHLSYMIEPVLKQYNMTNIQQHITQTRLINSLPKQYELNEDDQVDDEKLKQSILTTIASHLFGTVGRNANIHFKESYISQIGFSSSTNFIRSNREEDILNDVVNLVRNSKKADYNAYKFHIEHNSNVAFSWWLKDHPIPFIKKSWFPEDKHDQCFQYNGTHPLQVRSSLPLPPIVPINDTLSLEPLNIEGNYNLIQLGFLLLRRNLVSLPGFWPDQSDGFDFGNLLCLTYKDIRKRIEFNERDFGDNQDVLDGMAMTSSFAWLSSLATNLGFSIYHPLTYPLVTNVIITDGQHWSFYVYQLNNHVFHSDIEHGVQRYNLCWSSGEQKLFDAYEDGQWKGLDDNVLKLIVKMINTPEVSSLDFEARPYLGVDKRDQKDRDELRYSLIRKFANYTDSFVARRKKTNLWEKIYKHHKDAPLDVKRVRPKIGIKYPPFFTH